MKRELKDKSHDFKTATNNSAEALYVVRRYRCISVMNYFSSNLDV